jgi:pimeloyl-ACP methyl ester carboxylesterase
MSLVLVCLTVLPSAELTPGFHEEVRVAGPTRLDTKAASALLAPATVRLPAGYDGRQQRYQLFVPRGHNPATPAPLVFFVSPGDDPLGWGAWQPVCTERGLLFCAAYGAGSGCPPAQRVRLLLDVLDDLRRRCRIDPDRTYVCGLGSGGRVAAALALALPEYFGGVIAVSGTQPLPDTEDLRLRARDRLSLALIAGEAGPQRAAYERFHEPVARAVGVRARLWLVPRLGDALPPAGALAEALAWAEEDLKRRQADSATPLGASPDEVPDIARASARRLKAAQMALASGQAHRGAVLLRGLLGRWENTEAGDAARRLLQELESDPARARAVAEERRREASRWRGAQAEAFEQLGDLRQAAAQWRRLARDFPNTAEGRAAAEAGQRIAETAATTAYLGVVFASSDRLTVAEVVRGGPADRAGLEPGDRLRGIAGHAVADAKALQHRLALHRPGERLMFDVERDGKRQSLPITLGAVPLDEEQP